MADPPAARAELDRQVAHWTAAAQRLGNLDDFAAPAAWSGLEDYLGVEVRRVLAAATGRLNRQGQALRAVAQAAQSPAELAAAGRQLLAFRQAYLRTETMLDFYADAVNTRTNARLAAILNACDSLAHRSMAQVLDRLDVPTPPVLTYLDKGLGASILKAGLRLWDGRTDSPAAAVKIVRHNLHRPTSLIHEAGHQVAHLTGWNGELARALEAAVAGVDPSVAGIWAGWASEISADAFAFAHTGYAAVVNLHDVVAGGDGVVFRVMPGDPHPMAYLRVLLGVAMCRRAYGSGPWDDLAAGWVAAHPLARADAGVRVLARRSVPVLPVVAEAALYRPVRGFGDRPLAELVPPERVSPAALTALERRVGPALYTSMHWLWTESLRLLALSGLRAATDPARAGEVVGTQEDWMRRLGGALRAA